MPLVLDAWVLLLMGAFAAVAVALFFLLDPCD